MSRIRITGWNPGMMKVSLTKLIQAQGGQGLADAKAMTDRVLDGHPVEFDLLPESDPQAVVAELHALGALSQVLTDRPD